MASLKLWGCFFLVFLVFSKTGSRPLDDHLIRRKNLTKTLREALQKYSKELKVGFVNEDRDHDEDVMPSHYNYYNSKRVSPGGPDPKHHSIKIRE